MLQGDLWGALGKLREAHDSFVNAVAIASNAPKLSAEKWQEAFISQQACLHAQGKNDEALANLVPLLDSEEKLSLIMQGLLHRTLGNIYRSAANWHKAEYYLSSAVEIAKGLRDQVAEAKWTAELGRVYRSSGLHQKALVHQKAAYEVALKRGDVAQLAAVCGYIGFTNYSMKQPNHLEAIRYLGTRLLLAEKLLETSQESDGASTILERFTTVEVPWNQLSSVFKSLWTWSKELVVYWVKVQPLVTLAQY